MENKDNKKYNSWRGPLFITSSPSVSMDGDINPANGFLDELYRSVGNWTRCTFVSSHPDDAAYSDHCAYAMKEAFERVNINFMCFEILDRRTAHKVENIMRNTDFLILGGGHVPTQNAFLNEINLAEHLRSYTGVVLGISAGSMNMADEVYAWPEEEGETSPSYKRFLKGLGLTRCQILPHYYMVRDMKIDGLRAFEDIAYPDSKGRRFYVLPDGSYIYSLNGVEEVRGEAYVVENEVFRQISQGDERVILPPYWEF